MGRNGCNYIQCKCFFFEELNNNKFLLAIDYKLYNILGREVDRLYTGSQVPGYHSITWDAFEYSSGDYFVKMVAGEYVNTQKLSLIK